MYVNIFFFYLELDIFSKIVTTTVELQLSEHIVTNPSFDIPQNI